ncbi:MAG: DUF1730 domain-containing protein [Bdellovibrionales bacterium]
MMDTIVSQIHELFKSKDFLDYGFAEFDTPLSLDVYERWLQQNNHADMSYLAEHLPIKKSPRKHYPFALSAIVVLKQYWPHPYPASDSLFDNARIAKYALGEDYHLHFQKELERTQHSLQALFPGESFFCSTDSKPILERDLAYKAGLGWFGKNSMLIQEKKGSLFFIGEILTSIPLQSFKPIASDRCGTCTRCIDACPTAAIDGNSRTLNASRCISYLTIESKSVPEEDIRPAMGDWFLDVIFVNWSAHGKKPFQFKSAHSPMVSPKVLSDHLSEILLCSNKSLHKNGLQTHRYREPEEMD